MPGPLVPLRHSLSQSRPCCSARCSQGLSLSHVCPGMSVLHHHIQPARGAVLPAGFPKLLYTQPVPPGQGPPKLVFHTPPTPSPGNLSPVLKLLPQPSPNLGTHSPRPRGLYTSPSLQGPAPPNHPTREHGSPPPAPAWGRGTPLAQASLLSITRLPTAAHWAVPLAPRAEAILSISKCLMNEGPRERGGSGTRLDFTLKAGGTGSRGERGGTASGGAGRRLGAGTSSWESPGEDFMVEGVREANPCPRPSAPLLSCLFRGVGRPAGSGPPPPSQPSPLSLCHLWLHGCPLPTQALAYSACTCHRLGGLSLA